MSPPTKQCFVISPIGEPDSATRKRSDQVLKFIIRPAVEACGYLADRADEINRPGLITSQVIQRVVSDPLVVADLSERNPNVFYELAIRHAIRKPLVLLIQKGEPIPFDVGGARTIQVDHHDLVSVDGAKTEIINQIKSLEKDPSDLESPISMSLDLQMLRKSEKPEERSLAELLAAVSDLRSSVGKVEGKLPAVDELQASLKVLSSRIEEYIESPSSRRRNRFHPMMMREMMHFSPREGGRDYAILILSSMFRDEFPWVYEAGMEVYRATKRGSSADARQALREFQRLVEMTSHGPWGQMFGRSKESMMILDELDSLVQELIEKGSEPTP